MMAERLVVIDTNCLVQMISKRSPYRPIWDAFLGKRFVMCVSNDIIDEYQEILERLTTPHIAENVVPFPMFNVITMDEFMESLVLGG